MLFSNLSPSLLCRPAMRWWRIFSISVLLFLPTFALAVLKVIVISPRWRDPRACAVLPDRGRP